MGNEGSKSKEGGVLYWKQTNKEKGSSEKVEPREGSLVVKYRDLARLGHVP